MFRIIITIAFLFSGAVKAQELPCDHPDRTPLKISVPNVFTPNGDGVNDLFRSEYNTNAFDEYIMHIYNRSGQLMFYADRPAQGWDGRTASGTKCNAGTYFYIIDYKTPCKSDRLSGVLDLMR